MMKLKLICFTMFSLASVAFAGLKKAEREVSDTCTGGYRTLARSTLCVPDSPDYVAGSAVMSEADIRDIVNRHNQHRRRVSPKSSNMMKMYWDDELAKGAEKWARQCVEGHDSPNKADPDKSSRFIPAYGIGPGQNGAFGTFKNWGKVVDSWYSEEEIFQYGEDPDEYIGKDGWKEVASYTQMVDDTAVLVGCGYARCTTGPEHFYFCNYITAQSNTTHPYMNGIPCSACGQKCARKVCDCGGKFCFNGGTQNLTTCGCTCKYPFGGEQCLTRSPVDIGVMGLSFRNRIQVQ